MAEMNVGPTAEAEAESFGFLARQVKDERESNPYLMHLQQHSPMTQALADAWWRGWDRADAVLNGPTSVGEAKLGPLCSGSF